MTPLPSIAGLRRLVSNINSNNNNSSHNKIPSDSSATGTCASSSVKTMSELGTEEEQNNNNNNNNNNRSVIEDWESALRAEHADLRRRIEEVCDDKMVSDAKKKKKKNASKFNMEPDERGGNSSSSAVPGSPLKRRVSRHSYTIQEMALMSSPEKNTPRLATTATPETAAGKKKSTLKNMKNTRRRNPTPLSPPPKSTLYSSTYEIGARCYAKFTDAFWYWGTIVNILDPGAKYPSCSVSPICIVFFLCVCAWKYCKFSKSDGATI